MIGTAEVAQILDVPRRTIQQEWRAWGLHGIKINGKLVKFRERDITAWIERQEAQTRRGA
jgi:excisionase family DNA binding protein